MNTSDLLNLFSAVAALFAAGFWFSSALARMPKAIRKLDFGHIAGSDKPPDDMDLLTTGLQRQSYRSAIGAVFAGLAALLQAFASIYSLR